MFQFPTRSIYISILSFFLLYSCKNKEADMILVNGIIHTMDNGNSVVQACAIREGKIVDVGTTDRLLFEYNADTIFDLRGKSAYPGFIDAHCHYYGYAINLSAANLVGTVSWEDVLTKIDTYAVNNKREWIIGRGWDQNDWQKKDFPTNSQLNARFPDTPVFLKRVDGHAAIANQAALNLAGITAKTVVNGGKIGKVGNQLTGLLIDNAVDLVEAVVPEPGDEAVTQALKNAEKNLLAAGLTTVDDAGLDLRIINIIDSLQRKGEIRIRVYAMANPTEENFDRFLDKPPYKTDRINVRSFKIYADGALGSRGACLLKPYRDVGGYGFLLNDKDYYPEVAKRIYDGGFQMNTHCIGDSANRMILRLYGSLLGKNNDRRWRIEHAQVIDENDFDRFGNYNIIPSVQPVHATSDMYWAEDRLGKDRLKYAYAYQHLYLQNNMIAFGSDFPVEDINPLNAYYAAVTRLDKTGWPYGGFNKEDSLSRDICIKAMTYWPAYANFEEKEKGSIEIGKFADIVVFDKDIMFIPMEEVLKQKVAVTILGGEIVFKNEEL